MIDRCDQFGIHYNDYITDKNLLEESHNVNIVNDVIVNLDIPSEGYIVEYGSWRGSVINALTKLYGADRVFGFDISNFCNHPQVHSIDVRHLSGYSYYRKPIALAWNDLSNWEGSPVGKQASFDHALNNMVDNAIYIEHKNCPPHILKHPHLILEFETKHLFFFRYSTTIKD
jgi:hypothetical protein